MTGTLLDPEVRVLERLLLPGILGLRFWDVASGDWVREGLRVDATDASEATVEAIVNHSGVWHFPRLPRISGAIDPSAVTPKHFTIRVRDTRARFLPATFLVDAPVPGGLFDWPQALVSSPPSPPPDGAAPVPLFSHSSRPAPAGRRTVYADLWDMTNDRPAAWSLLAVTAPGQTGPETSLGLADERGSVAVFLPVPFAPVDGTRQLLSDRNWTVTLGTHYAPELTIDVPLSPPQPPGTPAPPMLDAVLAQLGVAGNATLIASMAPRMPLTQATLRFAEPLVLRTDPTGLAPRLQSNLLLEPVP